MPLRSNALDDVSPSPGRVVAKAVFNAAQELDLTQRDLARVIGVSEATVTRMRDGGHELADKPMELALCLIRVFRSLDAICGGESAVVKAWMRNPNSVLGGAPKALIATVSGLIEVMQYLDTARAPT
ncbi:MAG: transcriptional regulator, XRE family protein [Cereibacter sphaeroides]|uniref:Transcriptional regulator, XRE family protein n=1 Tax=Cereibacter sphaeroides TaxID=1063 RepID=A0A2W5SL95_CERSP|nr:MAG: transcriptional regulator, XRE family protein [Cereibacter sphaeroides]